MPGNIGMNLTGYEKLVDFLYGSSTKEIYNALQKASELLSEKAVNKKDSGNEVDNAKQFLKCLSEVFKELNAEPFVILEKE